MKFPLLDDFWQGVVHLVDAKKPDQFLFGWKQLEKQLEKDCRM